MNIIDKEWVKNNISEDGIVIIPSGVELIAAEAFKGNELIKKIILSDTVVEIGDSAFQECKNLQEVQFGNGIKTIGDAAFEECISLKSVNLPKSIEEVKEGAFGGCESLKSVVIDRDAKIKEIQDYTFAICKELEEVVLPKSVEVIGKGAFYQCGKIKNDILKGLDQLKEIKTAAFAECSSLTDVDIPDTVEKIEGQVFQKCKSLERVKLPKNLKKIEILTFGECDKLKNIELNDGLEVIGERAFLECKGLEEIKIPDSVKSIEKIAFSNCEKLKNIELGKNVEEIGMSAFFQCSSLEKISIPDSVRRIEAAAFSECSKLSEVEGGNGLEKLEPGVFYKSGIKRFTVPKNVKVVENALCNNESLEELDLGENTEEINSIALKETRNLRKVVIHGKIKYIPEKTFDYCDNIEEVEIKGSPRIHYGSFKGKDSIKKITIDGKEFNLGDDEKLYSLQKNKERVVLVCKDKEGNIKSKCYNLETGNEITQNLNVYLTGDGRAVRVINSMAGISVKDLEDLKARGETRIFIDGASRNLKPSEIDKEIDFDLYEIDDLIKVRKVIDEIKEEIVIPPKEDKHREKKIYAQLVKSLANRMEYDFYQSYCEAKTEEDKQNEIKKYETFTGKKWSEYYEQRKNSQENKNEVEVGNLLGLVNGRAVCRGNVEIIRILAAEFGIKTNGVMGYNHIRHQVKLDGIWYDDDFTNYQEYLKQGNLNKASLNFLVGKAGDTKIIDILHKGFRHMNKEKEKEVGPQLPKNALIGLLSLGRNKEKSDEEERLELKEEVKKIAQEEKVMQEMENATNAMKTYEKSKEESEKRHEEQ